MKHVETFFLKWKPPPLSEARIDHPGRHAGSAGFKCGLSRNPLPYHSHYGSLSVLGLTSHTLQIAE